MPLALVYQGQTAIPVEVEGLTPSWARGKTLGEIERFEIFHGNEKRPLADFFSVAGSTDDGRIEKLATPVPARPVPAGSR